jgi:hypothetical protein
VEVPENPGVGDFDVFGGVESDASRERYLRAKKNASRWLNWMVVGVQSSALCNLKWKSRFSSKRK